MSLQGKKSAKPAYLNERDAKIRHYLINYHGDMLALLLKKVHPHSYFRVDPSYGLICAISDRDYAHGAGSFDISRDLFRHACFVVWFGNHCFEILKNRDNTAFPFWLMPDVLVVASVLNS